MPTANDFKALAAQLPPSEKLSAADSADVLSALVAVAAHGNALLDAAAQGGEAVAAFYHQSAVDAAAAAGHPEPVRGQVVTVPLDRPATPAPAPEIDYTKLAQAIVAAQNPTPPAETTEGAL